MNGNQAAQQSAAQYRGSQSGCSSPRLQMFLLVGLLAISALITLAADPEPRQVRVAVLGTSDADEATLITRLSHRGDVILLERRQLERILGERSLSAPLKGPAVGRLLGAEFFLSLTPPDHLEAVGAQSGQIVYVGTSLDDAIRKMRESRLADQTRIAVIEKANVESRQAAAALREYLVSSGAVVLDRSLSNHVAIEHGLGENGFSGKEVAPMLGADLIVFVEKENHSLRLSVLTPNNGGVRSSAVFPLPAGAEPPGKALQWLNSNLGLQKASGEDYFPEIQIEALGPFYDGLAKFGRGESAAALLSFQDAYDLNDKFTEALYWEASCYDAMGFPRLARAARRFSERGTVGRGISAPMPSGAGDGICFLGVDGLQTPESRLVELESLNALVAVSPDPVLLPRHLSAWREEYDALAGVNRNEGGGWSRAPRFFVRRSFHGSIGDNGGIAWSLVDNLSGKVLARMNSPHTPDRQSLEKTFRDMLAGEKSPDDHPGFARWTDAPMSEREKHSGLLELLRKVQENPGDDSLWTARIKRTGDDAMGVDGYLNFGLRDELIARLPENSPHRIWLELARIDSFLPCNPKGTLFSDEAPDVLADLDGFAKRRVGTLAGAVAHYMFEFEKLSERSNVEIEKEWAVISTELLSAPGLESLENGPALPKMAKHIHDLAVIAQGKTEGYSGLPRSPYPYRLKIRLAGPGRPRVDFYDTYWRTGSYELYKIRREYWPQEAAVALRMLGRRTEAFRTAPEWLEQFPESFSLLDFAISSLFFCDQGWGLPFRHPFDAKQERENHRKLLDFCLSKLPEHLSRLTPECQFEYFCGLARKLVTSMQRYQFASEISDGEYKATQQKLAALIDATAARLGKSTTDDNRGRYWRTMPRRFDPASHPFWETVPDEARDPEKSLRDVDAAVTNSFASSPVRDLSWSRAMHAHGLGDWTSPGTRAALVAGRGGELQRLFSNGPLTRQEAGFLLDCAIFLFDGGRAPEAEQWFERITTGFGGDPGQSDDSTEILLNANLYRAFCLRRMGREREALDLTRVVVRDSDGISCRMISRVLPGGKIEYRDWQKSLRTFALRLLRDARMHELAKTKDNLRIVEVAAPDSPQKTVRFYFRIPAGKGTSPHRILVVVPSDNHPAPELCFGANPWTIFCDTMGWVLCAPDFDLYMDSASVPYHYAQLWSGDSLVKAVDKLAKSESLETSRLLLHGYGGGAKFVATFARFAPERCQAVSINGTGFQFARDFLPGLRPMAELRQIPLLITEGDEDDLREKGLSNLDAGIASATLAADAGSPVIWRSWPGIGHRANPEMENLARAFLADAASDKPSGNSYIGDRRNWEIFPAGDSKISDIPIPWRQALPSRALALAWSKK